jgi:hypothetical protein
LPGRGLEPLLASTGQAGKPLPCPSRSVCFPEDSSYRAILIGLARMTCVWHVFPSRSGRFAKSKKTCYSARVATENKYRTTKRSRAMREPVQDTTPGIPYVSGEEGVSVTCLVFRLSRLVSGGINLTTPNRPFSLAATVYDAAPQEGPVGAERGHDKRTFACKRFFQGGNSCDVLVLEWRSLASP